MKRFQFFLTYGLIFLGTFFILSYFQNQNKEIPVGTEPLVITPLKQTIAIGKEIRVNIQNNTDAAITLKNPCPAPFFEVSQFTGETYEVLSFDQERNCSGTKDVTIQAHNKTRLSLGQYAYTLFGETGRYRLTLNVPSETNPETSLRAVSPEITIKKPSVITVIWRKLIYTPIFNALIGLISILPGHSLGLAIIVLTFVIRTILLGPSVKAVRAQKRMQAIQPKIDALKEKYAHDQARLAQETMALWSKNKVNPFSSCLPLLIQFPVLIALFYVISRGLSPDQASLLYGFMPAFSFSELNPHFLGLDLLQRNLILLPIIVGLLQFGQMQLISVKPSGKGKNTSNSAIPSEVENANKMMKYLMPLMIAFFTSQLPAAVGLYWGTSTFYGVVQQLVVNKEGSSDGNTKSEDDVTVRVINKTHGKAH